MSASAWLLGVGAALLAVSGLAWPARSLEPNPSPRRVAWLKGLAASRAIAGSVLSLVAFSSVLEAFAGASDAERWTVTLAAGGCFSIVLVNSLAALWLLSPFVGADLGLEVVASRTRGRIRGYGWARLEVTTAAGWTAHLPYAAIALRPFVVCRQDGPRVTEIALRRERWEDDELDYLRQVAVLSPFRDASLPVAVTRRARVATLRLALARGASAARLRQQLERALARREAAGAASSERRGRPPSIYPRAL